MKRHLSFLGICLSVLAGSLAVNAAAANGHDYPWHTDYAKAQAAASESGKPILLKFTGSDWCPPCMRLDQEVFQSEEMITYADDSLVSVYVDFPRRKSLPAAQKQHNDSLAKEFGIKYFPTVWIVSPDGQKLGQLGYQRGGAEGYIESIKKILAAAQS
jgi:protein disulfide-isomerase